MSSFANGPASSRGYCNPQPAPRRSILRSRNAGRAASGGLSNNNAGQAWAQREPVPAPAPVVEAVRDRASEQQRRRRHHQPSRELEAPDGQTYNVPLWKRLSVPCDKNDTETLARLESDIKNQKPDMFVTSRTGVANAVNKDILCKISGYFHAISRSGMHEVQSSTVKMEIEQEHLRCMLDYVYHGSVRLTNANAAQIFQLAHYLQIDSLVETCCSYILPRVKQLAGLSYELGMTYSCSDLADAAVDFLCRNPDELAVESFSAQMSIDMFEDIFSRDGLQVPSEDRACELFLIWLSATIRLPEDILSAINCIRLPHITQQMEQRLTEEFDKRGLDVEALTLCKERRFTELPEEQLTPRDSYIVHVHILWQDELDYEKGPKRFATTCLRFQNTRIFTNALCQTVQHNYFSSNFEFIVAGDRILKVVQNNANTRLLLHSLESDGSLKHRATFEREAKMTDFALCADGSRCVVSFFNGFGDPPKFNLCDTTNWKKLEDFYKPEPRMLFSPREMAFNSDIVIIMRNQTVFVCDRQGRSVGQYELPEKLGRSSFVNFIRVGNKVYVYEDRTSGGIGDYLCEDRLHVVNLETKQFDEIIRVRFRPSARHLRTVTGHAPGRIRKFLRYGKQVYIIVQDDEWSNAFCFRFDPAEKTFGIPIAIMAQGFSCGQGFNVFSRRFLLQTPVYLHHCRCETLLQTHLRTLRGANRVKEIAKLGRFV